MAGLLSSEAKYGYIPGLDGLRALAVLIVMVAHVGFSHIVPGGFGVTVFFFISGFLITRLLIAESEKKGQIELKSFYIRRFLRLLPALFYMLIVTGLTFTFLGNPPGLVETLAAVGYVMNYQTIGLAFQGMVQEGPWGHLWSLAVEEHFYLMFPLLLIAFKDRLKSALKVCMALCAVVLSWRLVAHYGLNFPSQYTYSATDARLDSILYGCILSLGMHVAPKARIWTHMTGLLPSLLALEIILVCFILKDEGFRQTWRYSLQGLSLLVLTRNLYFLSIMKPLMKPLEWAPMAWTGKISYGLYLWHIPVIVLLDQYTEFTLGSPAFIALTFGLTYAVSAASFMFVEQPVIALRRRYGSHVTPVALGPKAKAEA